MHFSRKKSLTVHVSSPFIPICITLFFPLRSMKKIPTEPSIGKHRKRPRRISPLIVAFVLLLCTFISIYYFPTFFSSTTKLSQTIDSIDHLAEPKTLVEPLTQENGMPCTGTHCNDPTNDTVLFETTLQASLHGDTMWFHDTRPPDEILATVATTEKSSDILRGRGRRGGRGRSRGRGRGRGRRIEPQLIKPLKSEIDKREIDFLVSQVADVGNSCDLFSGEWVENPDGPYYTNMTCFHIQEHQNCMKFGRPDNDYLKWKWKPDGCELPVFDPHQFLELVRGKSLAFVGDSVARNHMQSLLCLLSRVVYPIDLTETSVQNKRFAYPEYDFNISMSWAPYLVKAEKSDPNDVTRPFNLFLDEFDEHWPARVESADYIIISAGHWFFRPTMFYVQKNLTGCLYCKDSNVRHLNTYFSYRRAFRTALDAINSLENFKGVTFLRTFAPSHFEGGAWDKGGDCRRTEPFKRDEMVLGGYNLEMYKIQLDELRVAQRNGRRKGRKFKLFDGTRTMLLRPDGHPSKYGHLPNQKVALANDCVHWCLPGPLDGLNDFLQELLIRELEQSSTF